MAGTCLINVNSAYVVNLMSIIEAGHSMLAEKLRRKRSFATDDATKNAIRNLARLSDILFYLAFWNEDEDDCKYVHFVKQEAMNYINFTESDIQGGAFTKLLLAENGTVFLTESGAETINQE